MCESRKEVQLVTTITKEAAFPLHEPLPVCRLERLPVQFLRKRGTTNVIAPVRRFSGDADVLGLKSSERLMSRSSNAAETFVVSSRIIERRLWVRVQHRP